MSRREKLEYDPTRKIFYNSDLYHTENNLYQKKKAEYDKIINEILFQLSMIKISILYASMIV